MAVPTIEFTVSEILLCLRGVIVKLTPPGSKKYEDARETPMYKAVKARGLLCAFPIAERAFAGAIEFADDQRNRVLLFGILCEAFQVFDDLGLARPTPEACADEALALVERARAKAAVPDPSVN